VSTLRALFAFSAVFDLELHMADVTKAFLSADQEEDVYMQQPAGFDYQSGRVWRLRKALYGLKQAACMWRIKLKEGLADIGYFPSTANPALFVHVNKDGKSDSSSPMLMTY
jgi:hypothetical protein